MKSIKTRIERSLVIAALIPLLIVAGYVYFNTQSTLQSSGVDNMNRQIQLLSGNIESSLKHVPGDLFYLRDANSMHHFGRALVVNDQQAIEEFGRSIARDFLSIAKNRRIYNQIRFIDAKGMELIRVEHNEQEGTSRILQTELLRDKSNSIYFQETTKLNFGDYYISPIDLNREDGQLERPLRPTLRFATPIFAVGERLVGVLILNVDANTFLDRVNTANKNEGLAFALSNPSGFLLANKQDNQLNWGGLNDLNHGQTLAQLLPHAAEQVLQLSQNTLLASDDKLVTGSPVYAEAEKTHLLGYLVAYAPKSYAFKLLNDFILSFAVFFVIAFIAILAFARKLSISLTKPLIYLTQAADKLSKGEMDTEISVKSNDEIQSLAEAFERLRESVKLLMRL